MVHPMKGIWRSHGNISTATRALLLAAALAKLYVKKKNGARNTSQVRARSHGRSLIRPFQASGPLRQSDREQTFRVDALRHLAKSSHPHQFVQFLLRAPAHDPGRACAMTGQSSRNELDLRMPWLAGVNQASAGFDCACQSRERLPHSTIFREELEQSRNDPDRRLRLERDE